MSDPPITPLPADIEDLLALERDAYGEEDDLKRAVLSQVEMAVLLRGPTGGGGPDGSPPPGGAGPGGAGAAGAGALGAVAKMLGIFAVGVAVGGVGARAIRPPEVTPVAAIAVASSVVVAPAPAPAASSAADAPDAAREVAPSPARPKPADVIPGGNDLVREREVIDAARAALSSGRPAEALVATTRHAERWPRGHLAEEREVIAIQALAATGRRAEAERRAGAFKRSFPSSMLIPAVDAALTTP